MAIARADETDLLIPLHEGPHDGWAVFLARLQQRLRAAEAGIVVRSGGGVTRYGSHDAAAVGLDPWLAGLRRGRVYAASERGEARPGRIVRADEAGGASAWLTVAREGRDFSAADGALLAALAPHLAVALRTLVALERASLRDAMAGMALDRAGVDWIAFARDARVLAASDPAARIGERLVPVRSEAGVALGTYCLAPTMPAAVHLPDEMMLLVPALPRHPGLDLGSRSLVGGGEGSGTPGQARGDGRGGLGDGHDGSRVAAIGLVMQPRDRDVAGQARVLASLYGLAPSEARLAAAVAGGMSLAEAAVANGLTIETARNYSKRVFAKMRVRGQVDLVRAIGGSVAGLV